MKKLIIGLIAAVGLATGVQRSWFAPRTGLALSANRYSSPFYIRSGLNVGVFHDF